MEIWLSSSSSSMNEYANDWDLHAAVRGYSNITHAATPDIFHSHPVHLSNEESVIEEEEDNVLFPNLQTTKNAFHELEELYKPFFSKSRQLPKETEIRQQQQAHHPKRKKNKQKKVVCQVRADDVSSDTWAWRKYGQKSIKGSPYPRGYYRCSSSKGCLARKQVERSQTDPTMLVISYTAEHNHPVPTRRSSLAGSTRSKFPLPPSKENVNQNLPLENKTLSPLSTLTMTSLSPTTSLTTSMEDELVMAKGEVAEENDDDDDDDDDDKSMVIKEDMGYMDLGKFGDVINDEDLVQKFFSNIWQVDGSSVTGAGGR